MKIFESRLSLIMSCGNHALCSLLYVKANSTEEAKSIHTSYITSKGYKDVDPSNESWEIKECNEERLNKEYRVKFSDYYGDWDYIKLKDLKEHENGILIHSYNKEVYNKFIKE